MNTKKFQTDCCDNCRIISRYEAIQNDQANSPERPELQAAKLEILEKLIRENKCPFGHNISNKA